MLMATPIGPGPTFEAGVPQPLFSVREYRTAQNRHQYDVAPDDDRFLMIKESPHEFGDLVYVENWLTELREKVGQ